MGNGRRAIAAGDFSGDTRSDVAVVSSAFNGLTLLLNNCP
jgi:hypothetical protein